MVHFRLRQSIIDKFKTGEYQQKPTNILDEIKSSMRPKPVKWWEKISKPTPPQYLRSPEELRRIGLFVPDDKLPTLNIMCDPRIYRGTSKLANRRKLTLLESTKKRKYSDAQSNVLNSVKEKKKKTRTPRAKAGRHNIDIQTDEHLEYIENDDGNCYEEAGVQTIPLYEFLPTEIVLPKAVENSKGTQVEDPRAFETFTDQHCECLKNLCHDITSRCLMEVVRKYERDTIKNFSGHIEPRIQEFQKRIKDYQLREDLVAEELKRYEKELFQRSEKQKSDISRLGDGVFTQEFINDWTSYAINDIKKHKNLEDPTKKNVRNLLIPWINNKVKRQFKVLRESADIIDEMIFKMSKFRGYEHCVGHQITPRGNIVFANRFDIIKYGEDWASYCGDLLDEVEKRDDFIQTVHKEAEKKLMQRKYGRFVPERIESLLNDNHGE